ncbi:MAG: hypothetical protein NPIRA05_05960 [Nitrospirales bacterium]|nr:MAG: hypothetical protein NPIRA05_05960 [Nitrospirales bacterium]
MGVLNNEDINGHISPGKRWGSVATGRFKKVHPARLQSSGTVILGALAIEHHPLLVRGTLFWEHDHMCPTYARSVLAIREHGTLAKPMESPPNKLADTAQALSQIVTRRSASGRARTPLVAFFNRPFIYAHHKTIGRVAVVACRTQINGCTKAGSLYLVGSQVLAFKILR